MVFTGYFANVNYRYHTASCRGDVCNGDQFGFWRYRILQGRKGKISLLIIRYHFGFNSVSFLNIYKTYQIGNIFHFGGDNLVAFFKINAVKGKPPGRAGIFYNGYFVFISVYQLGYQGIGVF